MQLQLRFDVLSILRFQAIQSDVLSPPPGSVLLDEGDYCLAKQIMKDALTVKVTNAPQAHPLIYARRHQGVIQLQSKFFNPDCKLGFLAKCTS